MLGEVRHLAGYIAKQIDDPRGPGVGEKGVEAMEELPDEDEAVEDCQRRQVVRVGLVTVQTGLHDDERKSVARQTKQNDDRRSDLQEPPAPRIKRKEILCKIQNNVIVIVISKLLMRHSKAKRRAPA